MLDKSGQKCVESWMLAQIYDSIIISLSGVTESSFEEFFF